MFKSGLCAPGGPCWTFYESVSMFLETRKICLTLHFPFGNLCFLLKSVRLFVFWKWALSYHVSIPCQMSTSEFLVPVSLPSLCMIMSALLPMAWRCSVSPVHGWVVLHCVYVLYLPYPFMWMDTDFLFREKSVPGFSVRVQCAGRSTQSLCVFIWLCSGMGC